MGLFSKENKAGQVDLNNLPCHVAVIMDGNGRWAQKRGLPRSAGHKAGAETFRKLGTYCKNLGIDYLTVYAFSTENWKRPKDEVDGIMHLLEQYLHECIDTMEKDGNRLRFLGDLRRRNFGNSSMRRMRSPPASRAFRPTSASTTAGATRSCTPPARLRVTARQGSRTRTL